MDFKKLKQLVKKKTQRERTPYQIKTIALFLYFNSLSLRAIDQFLQYLGYKVSHRNY